MRYRIKDKGLSKTLEKAEVPQSCPTLWPHGLYSLPGSSVHGILQARILEWEAIPFSMGSSQPRVQTQVSRIAGCFFTIWATREAHEYWSAQPIPAPGDPPDNRNRTGVSWIAGGFFTGWMRVLHNLGSSWLLFLLIWANHIEILQILKYAMLSQYFYLYVCLWFFLLPGMTIICLIVWMFLVFQDSAQISLYLKILLDHFWSQVKLFVSFLISPLHLCKPFSF